MELYRLCLKSATFKETPSFTISIGKTTRTLHPYSIPSDKQRYNCDTILERPLTQPYLSLTCTLSDTLIATAKLIFDSKRPQMPNQKLQMVGHNSQHIATLEVSLLKIDKVVQMPRLSVIVKSGAFEQGQQKPYLVLKYGELNFQTKSVLEMEWNQQFKFPSSEMERILVQSWCEVETTQRFLGVAIIPLREKMNTEHEYDVMLLNKKKGKLKIGVYEDKQIEENDYSEALTRDISIKVLTATLKHTLKKDAFVRIYVGKEQRETTPLTTHNHTIHWDQSFILTTNTEREQMVLKLCLRDQMEEEIGRGTLSIAKVCNRKYQISLIDSNEENIGNICVEFYDQNLDIKEEIPRKTVSKETVQSIVEKMNRLKARYSPKEPLFEYMQQVQNAVQEGLIHVAKTKPQNPLKVMGEFLISYEK